MIPPINVSEIITCQVLASSVKTEHWARKGAGCLELNKTVLAD